MSSKVLIFVISSLIYSNVFACVCDPVNIIDQTRLDYLIRDRAAVFIGVPVKLHNIKRSGRDWPYRVDFKVLSDYKGNLNDVVSISMRANSCSAWVVPNEVYLIFAYNTSRYGLSTNTCYTFSLDQKSMEYRDTFRLLKMLPKTNL